MKTRTVPIIDVLSGNAEGTILARVYCKLAKSGKIVHRLRTQYRNNATMSKTARAERALELQAARRFARASQSTIQVPVKVNYEGVVQ